MATLVILLIVFRFDKMLMSLVMDSYVLDIIGIDKIFIRWIYVLENTLMLLKGNILIMLMHMFTFFFDLGGYWV